MIFLSKDSFPRTILVFKRALNMNGNREYLIKQGKLFSIPLLSLDELR